MERITLAIVDDHMVVHDGVRAMAAESSDIELVWAADSSEQLEELVKDQTPDILLLDLRLGLEDGFAVCRKLRGNYPGIRILMFTAFGNVELLQASIRAGASGYVLKDVSTRNLPDILRHVSREGSYFDSRLASRIVLKSLGGEREARSDRPLTEREIQIVRLIAAGKVNREIASELHLSPHTVKFHISKLMRDLGVSRRAELVRVALDRQLL